MKLMSSAVIGASIILGTAALSFGAQDTAAPAKTETKTVEATKTAGHKAKKHPKKVTTEQKSMTTSSTTTSPAK